MVGLTGLEPVTLRLSSACSNQLSYRPVAGLARTGLTWLVARVRGLGSAYGAFSSAHGTLPSALGTLPSGSSPKN
jgi:hypothetical protein